MGYYFDVFAFACAKNKYRDFVSMVAVYKALMEIRNFIKVKVDSDEKKAEIS